MERHIPFCDVIQGVSPDGMDADAFGRRDPYMEAGLIRDHRIERGPLV